MNSCFATGGPSWLFPLLLGSAIAAFACLVRMLASAGDSEPALQTTLRRQATCLAAGLGLGIAFGLPVVNVIALFVPLLLVGGVLRAVDRPVTAGTAGGARAEQPKARLVVLGVLTGTVALGALAAMILQGGPC